MTVPIARIMTSTMRMPFQTYLMLHIYMHALLDLSGLVIIFSVPVGQCC